MTISFRFIPIAVGAILVTAMGLETQGRPSAADGVNFHAAAAKAVAELPLQFGEWKGEEVPVPAAAQVLLKPNAIVSRRFTNRRTGETLSMSLVQCRDTRDMAGHYPPICYPGMGWVEKSHATEVSLDVDGVRLIAMRYHFSRHFFDQERVLVVYNFFAMPGEGFPSEMESIRRAAADYTSRPYGAAQVQVALNQAREPAEEKQLVQSVLMPCAPALRLLSDSNWKKR
jgi:hypothetical protein